MTDIQELTDFLKTLTAETDRRFRELSEEQRIRSADLDRKFREISEEQRIRSADLDRKFREISEEQRIRSADLDRKFRELSESQKETSAEVKETSREIKETSRELKELGKETDRRIRELAKSVGGISDSNGRSAEQFFSSALAQTRTLNGMTFEAFAPNVSLVRTVANVEVHDEFDVVLFRADAVALVEIKYRLRKDDVEYLARKKVENYRVLFPNEVTGKAIYLAAAGLSIERGVVEVAKKLGVYILTQKGEGIQILNDEVMAY